MKLKGSDFVIDCSTKKTLHGYHKNNAFLFFMLMQMIF